MLSRLFLALLAVVAVTLQTGAGAKDLTVDDIRLALYDIDHSIPLEAVVQPAPPLKNETTRLKELRTRHLVRFVSACDQRVPCILAIPKKRSPRAPAVILLAGSGGHKDTDYVRITSDMLNTMGIITLSMDAQYHGDRARKGRSGDIHFIQNVTNRDAWVQTVRDLRRCVDYLLSRKDVDPERIGFVGFSQGAMLGATFLGVEPRVKAACLAVPGAGFVEWARRLGIASGDTRSLEIGAAMTDPIHFIRRFSPRPLLILAARKDELIPASATEALVGAAGPGHRVIWYHSGHVLPPNALVGDLRNFVAEHLVARTKKEPPGH